MIDLGLVAFVEGMLGKKVTEDGNRDPPDVPHLVQGSLELLQQQADQEVILAELFGQHELLFEVYHDT